MFVKLVNTRFEFRFRKRVERALSTSWTFQRESSGSQNAYALRKTQICARRARPH